MKKLVLLAFGVLFWITGCGTHRGIYHTVSPGENVYRISLAYGVSQDDILGWNSIDDPASLRAGQQLYIPGASTEDYKPQGKKNSSMALSTSASSRNKSEARQKPREERREANLSPKPVPTAGKRQNLRWPVRGTVTSGYGFRGGLHHDGLDISAEEGTSIQAAADGRVLYAGDGLSGYGNLIIVRHAGDLATVYAHNKENRVKKGDFVAAGQVLGTVGQTGRASAPHLHFEVRRGKKAVDPTEYLP